MSDYPDLGCLPDGMGAVECWIDERGRPSHGYGVGDRASHYLCMVDTDEYWIGPLEAGIAGAVYEGWSIRVCHASTPKHEHFFTVLLADDDTIHDQSEENALSNASKWGTAASLEIAWRYALAGVYGPTDDEYDEERLRRYLAQWADPVPDTLTPHAIERWLAS